MNVKKLKVLKSMERRGKQGRFRISIDYLEKGVIKKVFRGEKKKIKDCFLNEVYALTHLKIMGCDFVPKILDINIDVANSEYSIYMTNCGENAEHNEVNYKKAQELVRKLRDVYHLKHVYSDTCEYTAIDWVKSKKSYIKNTLIKDGKLYLIDFELYLLTHNKYYINNWMKYITQ